jgi:dienelactone hydrolase
MNRRTIHKLLVVGTIALAGTAAATGFALGTPARMAPARAAPPSLVLPSPTGRSAVGTVSLHWIDGARPDPFDPNKRRELMVQFWCPSEHATGSPRARYLPARTARALERLLGISTPVFDRISVHAQTGARAASGRHPVVLFSPGFGVPRGIYTALLEDLASDGFVVVALDHPYDAAVVEFPGGRLERQRFADPAPNRAVSIRIADARFVLDRLQQVNTRGRLAGKLDLQHIGMFGHSVGGAVAAEVMLRDARVDAAANVDGSFRQTAERRGVRGPFMLITAPRGVGPSEQAYRAGLGRSQLRLTLRGAEHYTFSDFVLTRATLAPFVPSLPTLRKLLPIGSIDRRRALAIERRYLDAFFRRHLKGTRELLLTRAFAAYPEVSFERGTH